MTTAQTTNRRRPVIPWQIALCFLLAVLFLYNPFQNNQAQDRNLAVSHPVSHRATVGSSELEQFSQRNGVVAPLPDLEIVQLFVNLTPATLPTTRSIVDRQEGMPPQTVFSSSLWFRPPPAV